MQRSTAGLWCNFAALTRIARPPGGEQGAREWVQSLATVFNLETRRDAYGNLVVRVPGRGAGRSAPVVVVQAHLDMVCVGPKGETHDFCVAPIRLFRRKQSTAGVPQEVLQADGTTLGADNGIGVAAALALIDEKELRDCPPLELLFTVEEEIGLRGALHLDPDLIRGRRLLNLDNEESGTICMSCAGGRDMSAAWTLQCAAPEPQAVSLRVSLQGLPGGHSGVEIHQPRGNAIVLLLEAVLSAGIDSSWRLSWFEGGVARNVIPSAAVLEIQGPSDRVGTIRDRLLSSEIRRRLERSVAPEYRGFSLQVEQRDAAQADRPIVEPNTEALFRALTALQAGPIAWSPDYPELVETSNNVARIRIQGERLELLCNTRSSRDGAVEAFQDAVAADLRQTGAEITFGEGYPGWPLHAGSALLERARPVFAQVLGSPPHVTAVHAGLECGAFRRQIADLDMISFGPDIREAHTSSEYVVIDSVAPFWCCLTGLLEALCSG